MKRFLLTLSLLMTAPFIRLYAAEIDQITDRQKYQETARDFTETLNGYTNSRLKEAVENFNRQYDVLDLTMDQLHRYLAFEIYKATAGNKDEKFSDLIPDKVSLIYALGKSGRGPIQEWIESDDNSTWWTKLGDNNIYSEIIPEPFNKNYIIKVGGEFIGPDKIDHFFDQGYSYWLKSRFGKDDQAALRFGMESEAGWYGLKSGGVFSFADLRANWGGYQFYKSLLEGDEPLMSVSEEGIVVIHRDFDWASQIDRQFDELKNPSVLTRNNMKKICRHIEENIEKYRDTYNYLESLDFFENLKQRDNYYTTGELDYDPDLYFDLPAIMAKS